MKLDPQALDEFDFSFIVDDPCKDFSQTGILKDRPSERNSECNTDLLESSVNYKPEHPGLLSINRGDKLQNISELDEWVFAENLDTGNRGFYPHNLFDNVS